MQEWKPRWGYKRVNDPKEKWMIEIPERAGEDKLYTVCVCVCLCVCVCVCVDIVEICGGMATRSLRGLL